MNAEEMKNILAGLVRVGTVMNRDEKRTMVRVKFQSEDMTSGWLRVLQHRGTSLLIQPDGGHSHSIQDTYTGGGTAQAAADHDHGPGSRLGCWLPEVGETVLCLYLPVFNADGYVLGGIGGDVL